MMNRKTVFLGLLLTFGLQAAGPIKVPLKKGPPEPSPLDKYISESMGEVSTVRNQASPGSLWTANSRFTDLGGDIRASQVNDLVTILVAEQASAVATGDVKTGRTSSVKSSVSSLLGPKSVTGAYSNLANAASDVQLQGQGATSRGVQLNTTLSARVTHVLPNGYLVLEGTKEVQVNSERQLVIVRGVARPADLSQSNSVNSDQLAQLEIRVNGKGVIGDAVRRPFLLYRILLGLLPF